MKLMTSMLALLMLVAATAHAEEAEAPDRLMPEPLRDLGRSHKVRLIYFVPADREPIDAWAARIETLVTFANDAIRRDLVEKGYEDAALDFEFDEADELVIHLVRGEHPTDHYSGAPDYNFRQQWVTVNTDVEAELGPPSERVHLIFAETYDKQPAPHEWAGGNAQAAFLSADTAVAMKSAWILRPEFTATDIETQLELLFDDTPIEGRTAMGHGQPNSPRHHFIEDGFGAVVHELGHALSLYHDSRDGLYHMGNGFRQLRTRYRTDLPHDQRSRFSDDAARMLVRSRFISESAHPKDLTPPRMTIRLLRQPQSGDRDLRIHLEAEDDTALAAFVFHVGANDSVAIGGKLEGKSVTLDELRIGHPEIQPGQQIHLQGRIVDEAGNFARLSLTLTVPDPAADDS